MTIYDIPNIEHCDIETIGTMGWRLRAHDGWYIYKSTNPVIEDLNGNQCKLYQTVVAVRNTENLAGIEITAEVDLPDNAIINGGGTGNDHEVM